MSNLTENLEDLTYQMSDEELVELGDSVLESNMKRYGVTDLSEVSDEKADEITDCLLTVPLTKDVINSFVKLGFYSREELESENRRLYATREWEQYL